MGIRHLPNPPLPAGYYGDAFQFANAVLTGRDLNEWPLSRVAKMIKESKKVASDTNYIWNSINLLEMLRHHKMKIETGSECLIDGICGGVVGDGDSGKQKELMVAMVRTVVVGSGVGKDDYWPWWQCDARSGG
ncbi:hypothetical protein RJ639_018629 [Escallonia herrerae]|uniref:Uncharacterized protein n=1 Tax=Escallonia herrerae TaxID=1293975 RepID=A0AA88V7Z8_9ASTE|nr:hypothetical protein RJ639_018629 [Escallonia herrerae]